MFWNISVTWIEALSNNKKCMESINHIVFFQKKLKKLGFFEILFVFEKISEVNSLSFPSIISH